jgi:hypothetical protein
MYNKAVFPEHLFANTGIFFCAVVSITGVYSMLISNKSITYVSETIYMSLE